MIKNTNKTNNSLITTLSRIRRQKMYYLFLLPAAIAVFIFNYLPMVGIGIAFQDFKVQNGFFGNEFVGLENFVKFVKDPTFIHAFMNTIKISLLSIVFVFPAPIILSLMIDNVKNVRMKKLFQTITYLPHFVSWIIVATLVYRILDPYGGLNLIIKFFGHDEINFMREGAYFKTILILSNVWKEVGWNSIIYLAAISSINPELYQAAMVDGAGKFKQILHITLPCIAPTIALMFILNLGNLVRGQFDSVYNLMNPLVATQAEVIDTYVYRTGIQLAKYSYATAVGLAQSLFSIVLVFIGFKWSKKMNGHSIID
ncbi:ABC transporter permease [Lachnoclostridium sp.]|uniref:ABC transporter permease n=1 Tax=Lachnoclostridium sp. TaxID=2028282 RepID=UPI002896596A|nr:ABC transporter permease subunit [Lachnoclostridium sp.]